MKKENIFCPLVITLQGHWRSKEVVAQSACVVFSYHPKSEKKKIRFFHKICYILSFTYYKYLCPSFSLISRFPTNGSGNTNKMRQKKSCQNTASKKRKKERNTTNVRQNSQVYNKLLSTVKIKNVQLTSC